MVPVGSLAHANGQQGAEIWQHYPQRAPFQEDHLQEAPLTLGPGTV